MKKRITGLFFVGLFVLMLSNTFARVQPSIECEGKGECTIYLSDGTVIESSGSAYVLL